MLRHNKAQMEPDDLHARSGLDSSRAQAVSGDAGMFVTGTGHAQVHHQDAPLSVAIIGHTGRMGTMLTHRLSDAGHVVSGMELRDDNLDDSTLSRKLAHCRIVLLCVPVTAISETLDRLRSFLTEEHMLMDITSVKVLPMRLMEQGFHGGVIGSHPMFGPHAKPEDMRVALVRGARARAEDCRLAEQVFMSFGCRVFWTSAEDHDAGVALSQSLTFAISAAFLTALGRHKDIRPYLTPSFKRHMEAARMHMTKDTAMFLEFTSQNPEFPAALKRFQEVLEEAASGSLDRLAAEASRWYEE